MSNKKKSKVSKPSAKSAAKKAKKPAVKSNVKKKSFSGKSSARPPKKKVAVKKNNAVKKNTPAKKKVKAVVVKASKPKTVNKKNIVKPKSKSNSVSLNKKPAVNKFNPATQIKKQKVSANNKVNGEDKVKKIAASDTGTNTKKVALASPKKADKKIPSIDDGIPSNVPPGRFELEYVVHSSAELLFNFLTEPSGLSEWFCDDVNIRHGIYTFFWDGTQQQAKELKIIPEKLVRFQWIEKTDGSYFEFRIEKDDLTGDISLIITDFAETDDEKNSSKLLWDSQIDKLLHVMGAYF